MNPRYYNDEEGTLHPLWLGILILFFVIIILGLSCCLRIKFGSYIYKFFTQTVRRKSEKNENAVNDVKNGPISDSHNWSSNNNFSDNSSRRMSKVVPDIYVTNSDQESSVVKINTDGNKLGHEPDSRSDGDSHSMSLLPSIDHIRSSEIARKFYASMRDTTQHQAATSVDSYDSDSSLAINNLSGNHGQKGQLTRESSFKLTHSPYFFQSIPYTDGLALGL